MGAGLNISVTDDNFRNGNDIKCHFLAINPFKV